MAAPGPAGRRSHLDAQFGFIIKPLQLSPPVRTEAVKLLRGIMARGDRKDAGGGAVAAPASSDAGGSSRSSVPSLVCDHRFDDPDMDALAFQNVDETYPLGVPHPKFSCRIWSACAVFITCAEFEDSWKVCDRFDDEHPETDGGRPRQGVSGRLTGIDRPIKLNQIVRMAGINFNAFFQHMNMLESAAFRPNFFEKHKAPLGNLKLTFLYDYVLHEQWRNIWATRTELARSKLVCKRGKLELETKLQQFAWILFLLCKARFLEHFEPTTAFPLLVCCTSLVLEAFSASVDPPPAPIVTGSATSTKVEAAAGAATAGALAELPPSTTDPLDFFANIAMASNPVNPNKEGQQAPSKPKIPIEETDVHASVLSLLVPKLGNVSMQESEQFVDRIQDFVDELASNGYLLGKDGPPPPARVRGNTRDSLRAICAPKKLSSNGYNLSKIYNNSHQSSICNLDETIFLDQFGMQKSIHAWNRFEASSQENGLMSTSSSPSSPLKGKKRRRRGAFDDHLSSASDSDYSDIESYPPSASMSKRPRTSMEDRVRTSNWMLKVVNSRKDGPSAEIIHFYHSCPSGDALLERAKSQLHVSVNTFLSRLFGGTATVESPSEELRALKLSLSQALRLYWSVIGKIVSHENSACQAPIASSSTTSSSGSMSTSSRQTYIVKLLGNTSFQRAMLACATEIVLVANGQLEYLFPRSSLAFDVTPFQFFKALNTFMRLNGKSIPERLRLHLLWCNEQLVVVHSWIAKWGGINVSKANGLFTMMHDHSDDLHRLRMRSMRSSMSMQSRNENGDNKRMVSAKGILPSNLASFMHKLEKLAAKRLSQLCGLLGLMGTKSLGDSVHAHSVDSSSDATVSSKSGLLSDRELIDQMWTLLKFVFYDCWWLMRNRHLDQLIVCSVYAICKWHNRGILFHTIAQHYSALPASISTGAGIGENFEGSLDMLTSCDMECMDGAQECCSAEIKGEVGRSGSGDAVPVKGTVIEFYNKVFLPRTQDFLMELQNDGGKHGALITDFPAHRDALTMMRRRRTRTNEIEDSRAGSIKIHPSRNSAAWATAAATDRAGQQKVEKQGLQPLTEPSIYVKEIIMLVMNGANDE